MGSTASKVKAKVPNLDGKTIIVTGSNSGIGFEAAKIFAEKGATVILACRSKERGEAAKTKICEEHSAANVVVMQLDLADLNSIESFIASFRAHYEKIDVLVNNAGVVNLGERSETVQGYEIHYGVNVLGHFALTVGLIDLLEKGDMFGPSRVVNVTSVGHMFALSIDFDDFNGKKSYNKHLRYVESKLLNIMMTYAMQRKFLEKEFDIIAVSCHPGYSQTGLTSTHSFWGINRIGQSALLGSLPTVMAATFSEVKGGDYIGPLFFQVYGSPAKATPSPVAMNEDSQNSLWEQCVATTGYDI